MPDYSYHFIINPISGLKKDFNNLINLLNKEFAGLSYFINYTQSPGHATELACKSAKSSNDIVVAIGGDGTLNEVASGVLESDSALGLIPRGSGNGFARSLHIPLQLERAIQFLKNPTFKKIDSVKINADHFFGVAGIGLDARISDAFQNFGNRGPLPYFYVGLKEFFKYDYPEVIIQTESRQLKVNPLLITVANTPQYGNGAVIAPQADFCDGQLDICIVEKIPIHKAVPNVATLFNDTVESCNYYSAIKSSALKIINPDKRGLYHIDGEPKSEGYELDIKILPLSLKVATPITC